MSRVRFLFSGCFRLGNWGHYSSTEGTYQVITSDLVIGGLLSAGSAHCRKRLNFQPSDASPRPLVFGNLGSGDGNGSTGTLRAPLLDPPASQTLSFFFDFIYRKPLAFGNSKLPGTARTTPFRACRDAAPARASPSPALFGHISAADDRSSPAGSTYIMEKLLLLHIFLFCWRSLNALFTVEAPKSLYTAELGSNVTMECVFPVNGKLKFRDLSVIWEKKDEVRKDVYILLKGKEDSGSQHSDFQGRIKLLKENLDFGQSLLQISNVKLRDAGLYHCLIEYGGADYKTINLKVQAPYRTITQEVVSTGDKEWKLTCQSEGYPKAEVMWQNGECQDLTDKANTSYETGSDQLYRVTSTLTVKNRTCENFRCIFWNKEIQENTSANLYILDSADDVLWTESRRFVWPVLIVSALVGSVPITVCIRKARASKDCRTRMAKSSIHITKLSKDKGAHDCRGPSFEDAELKYIQIETT